MLLRNLWKVKTFCVVWKLNNWMLSITVNFYIQKTEVFQSSDINSLKEKFIFIIFIMIIFIVSFVQEDPHTSFFKFQIFDNVSRLMLVFSLSWKTRYSWSLYNCAQLVTHTIFRSSRQEVLCKKGVPRNFTKFTGKRLYQSLFFNKVSATLLRKRLWHTCFPAILLNF